MLFLELAAQNVKGLSPRVRATLRPGYVVLQPLSAELPPLALLLTSLLYPDAPGGAQLGNPSAKLGLSFSGDNQTTYRLVREGDGRCALSALDAEAGKFGILSQSPEDIARHLRGHTRMPPLEAFEQLWVFSASQTPGQRQRAQRPTDANTRMVELQRELQLAREVERAESALDGLSVEQQQLVSELDAMEACRAECQRLEAERGQLPDLEVLGPIEPLMERLSRYPGLMAKRDEALARLEGESSEPSPGLSVESLWANRNFWTALALGAVFFCVGVSLPGVWRYLALLDIPAFGWAAWMALAHFQAVEQSERQSRKASVAETRRKKILEDFDKAAGPVQAAMKAVYAGSITDLTDILSRAQAVSAKAAEARRRLAELEASPKVASAKGKLAKVDVEHQRLSQQLNEKSAGYVRSSKEVEREMASLQKGPSPEREEFIASLLKKGADLAGMKPAEWAKAIGARAGEFLEMLGGPREWLRVAGDGVALTEAAAAVPALSYWAVRCAMWEKLSATYRVPAIWADPLLPSDVSEKLAKVAKSLGASSQLLHLAADAHFLEASDSRVSV